MIKNPGGKIKSLSTLVFFIVLFVFAVSGGVLIYSGIRLLDYSSRLMGPYPIMMIVAGALLIVIGVLVAWLVQLFIYAFGSIVEDVETIRKRLSGGPAGVGGPVGVGGSAAAMRGASVGPGSAPVETRCTHCGARLKPGTVFCGVCGARSDAGFTAPSRMEILPTPGAESPYSSAAPSKKTGYGSFITPGDADL